MASKVWRHEGLTTDAGSPPIRVPKLDNKLDKTKHMNYADKAAM